MRRTVLGEANPSMVDIHVPTPRDPADDLAITVTGLVRRQARLTPDAVAIEQGQQAITYAALVRWADDWSDRLIQAGVRSGDRVAVRLGRRPELVAAMLGSMQCGAAYVPLDPTYPEQRQRQMLDDAQVRIVVDEEVSPAGAHAVLTPSSSSARVGPAITRTAITDDVAYVLYTSGSTGRPKGVELTHGGAVDMLQWAAAVLREDLRRVLASTSVSFDCSILEIFGPLTTGGTTVLADGPLSIGSTSTATGVTLLHSVPSVIDELLRNDHLPTSVRTAIVGGEAVWAGLVDRVYGRSSIRRLVNLYGPTEYTSYATIAVLQPGLDGVPPIGRPVANTRIDLRDGDGVEVAEGETGEIVISGAGLARGYFRRPAQTAERFVPDPRGMGARAYRTGDLGYWTDGQLRFAGRIDDQVKVRGVRIEPGEVERAVLRFPGVREAVVLAEAGPSCSSAATPAPVSLTAHVVADVETSADPSALRRFLADVLPSAMLPSSYVFSQRLPRMPNGKIDRSLLRRSSARPTLTATRPFRSHVEEALVRFWREALDVDDVDPDADLFDLGSHSLTALSVRARAEREFEIAIPPALFFEHSTVADVVDALTPFLAPAAGTAEPARAASPVASSELSPTQTVLLDRGDPSLMVVSRLVGAVRLTALGHALRTVQRRHALLTSVLDSASIRPRWRAADAQPPLMVDASEMEPDAALATARGAIDTMLNRDWDLRRERASRWAIVRLGHNDHLLVVALHPAVADPWSAETLGHQVLELYAAAIHGGPASVGTYAQYTDLAAHRHAVLSTAEGARQRRFWARELEDAPLLLPPGDRGRQPTPGPVVTEIVPLPRAAVRSIEDLARAARATPQMVIVAFHALALSVWTGQLDIVVGCPTSGRPLVEHATLVGPAGDAVAIRCTLRSDMSLTELVAQVRAVAMDAYGCDAVPFVELAANAAAFSERHPVYQTSAVLLARPSLLDPGYSAEIVGRQPIGPVDLLPFGERPSVTALDVELAVSPREGELEAVVVGRGDVVSPRDLARYARYLALVAERGSLDAGRTVEAWHGLLKATDPDQ